jgi:hypothetical protein
MDQQLPQLFCGKFEDVYGGSGEINAVAIDIIGKEPL